MPNPIKFFLFLSLIMMRMVVKGQDSLIVSYPYCVQIEETTSYKVPCKKSVPLFYREDSVGCGQLRIKQIHFPFVWKKLKQRHFDGISFDFDNKEQLKARLAMNRAHLILMQALYERERAKIFGGPKIHTKSLVAKPFANLFRFKIPILYQINWDTHLDKRIIQDKALLRDVFFTNHSVFTIDEYTWRLEEAVQDLGDVLIDSIYATQFIFQIEKAPSLPIFKEIEQANECYTFSKKSLSIHQTGVTYHFESPTKLKDIFITRCIVTYKGKELYKNIHLKEGSHFYCGNLRVEIYQLRRKCMQIKWHLVN